MGYAGGTTDGPDYHKLGDHTETVQVDYDPAVISYEELLDVFWDSHAPAERSWSRQYMSIIFYHNEEQKRLAEESRHREEARLGQKIFTEIVPASEFYLAEAYHQKYYLTSLRELMKDLTAIYPDTEDFVASTAVARLNGYAGGYGTPDALREQLNSFGLSDAGKEKLLEIAEQGLRPGCAVR